MASRAVHRRKPYPELARDSIKIGQCLSTIARVEKTLVEDYASIDLAQVPALKLLADIQFKKLAKVLPDLKAIDHTGQLTIDTNINIKVGG